MTFFEKSHKPQRFYYNLFRHSTCQADAESQLGFVRIFISAGKVPKLVRFFWHQLSAPRFNVAEKCNFRRCLHFRHRAIKMMHTIHLHLLLLLLLLHRLHQRKNWGWQQWRQMKWSQRCGSNEEGGYYQLDNIKMQWSWYLLFPVRITYTHCVLQYTIRISLYAQTYYQNKAKAIDETIHIVHFTSASEYGYEREQKCGKAF